MAEGEAHKIGTGIGTKIGTEIGTKLGIGTERKRHKKKKRRINAHPHPDHLRNYEYEGGMAEFRPKKNTYALYFCNAHSKKFEYLHIIF